MEENLKILKKVIFQQLIIMKEEMVDIAIVSLSRHVDDMGCAQMTIYLASNICMQMTLGSSSRVPFLNYYMIMTGLEFQDSNKQLHFHLSLLHHFEFTTT